MYVKGCGTFGGAGGEEKADMREKYPSNGLPRTQVGRKTRHVHKSTLDFALGRFTRWAPREGATPDKGERRALRRLASFSSPTDVEDLEAGEY